MHFSKSNIFNSVSGFASPGPAPPSVHPQLKPLDFSTGIPQMIISPDCFPWSVIRSFTSVMFPIKFVDLFDFNDLFHFPKRKRPRYRLCCTMILIHIYQLFIYCSCGYTMPHCFLRASITCITFTVSSIGMESLSGLPSSIQSAASAN